MPSTLLTGPLTLPFHFAVEPAGPADLAAEPADADWEPVSPYSTRACPKDGTSMTIEHRDAQQRRWSCPACGSHRR